jgi:hypothetical protein
VLPPSPSCSTSLNWLVVSILNLKQIKKSLNPTKPSCCKFVTELGIWGRTKRLNKRSALLSFGRVEFISSKPTVNNPAPAPHTIHQLYERIVFAEKGAVLGFRYSFILHVGQSGAGSGWLAKTCHYRRLRQSLSVSSATTVQSRTQRANALSRSKAVGVRVRSGDASSPRGGSDTLAAGNADIKRCVGFKHGDEGGATTSMRRGVASTFTPPASFLLRRS